MPKIQENSPKILKIIKKIPWWLGDWELAKNGMGAYVSKNFYMLEKSEKNRENSKNSHDSQLNGNRPKTELKLM